MTSKRPTGLALLSVLVMVWACTKTKIGDTGPTTTDGGSTDGGAADTSGCPDLDDTDCSEFGAGYFICDDCGTAWVCQGGSKTWWYINSVECDCVLDDGTLDTGREECKQVKEY